MSGAFLSFLLCLAPAATKIFSPCETARILLKMTIEIAGESFKCSPSDVARMVCMASHHNFDSSYSFTMDNNETAVGLFGVPYKSAKYCAQQGKSDKIEDHFKCLVGYQFKRNSKPWIHSLISEVLCNETNMSLRDISRILKVWNRTAKKNWFSKTKVTCQRINVDYLYVANQNMRWIYRPGVLDSTVSGKNETDYYREDFENSCRGLSYCMNK